MFSDEITSSDAFLEMPDSAQNLYFHLGMSADDDGFIGSPKMVMRVIRAGEDDYKILVAKKFILHFEKGICVVKHWRINNQIRKDRYKETRYLEEKGQLFIKENGAYTQNSQKGLPVPRGHFTPTITDDIESGNQPATNRQPSIGKVRLGKDSKDTVVELPDWLDKETWEMWVNYRKEKKKPLTGTSIKLQLKLLEEHKSDHKSILLKSIQNSWTGLFPPSGESKKQGNNALVTKHSQELIDHAKKTTIKLKS
jgi:hypothetical protein